MVELPFLFFPYYFAVIVLRLFKIFKNMKKPLEKHTACALFKGLSLFTTYAQKKGTGQTA
jgi:hypothetical protein